MRRFFVSKDLRLICECFADKPANPECHEIVTSDQEVTEPYQRYIWSGSSFIEEPVITPVTPLVVTRYQGRAALLQMGLLDDIDAYYAALPIDTEDTEVNMNNRIAKERWAGMLNFERDSDELVELASAFGLSATQVDDLFCFAATIK